MRPSWPLVAKFEMSDFEISRVNCIFHIIAGTGLRLRKTFHDVMMTSSCKVGEVSPDARSCAKYFECVVEPSGNTSMRGQECDYPQLFSAATGKCENFKDVACSPGQVVPKNPCKFDTNLY